MACTDGSPSGSHMHIHVHAVSPTGDADTNMSDARKRGRVEDHSTVPVRTGVRLYDQQANLAATRAGVEQ